MKPLQSNPMRSLSTRVAVSAGIVLAVFIVLSALALEKAFRESARAARQERLLAQLYLVMAATEVDSEGKITLGSGALEPRLDLPGSGLYAAILDGDGNVIWKSRSHLAVVTPVHQALKMGERQFEERVEQGTRFLMQRYGIDWHVGDTHHPFTFSVAEHAGPFDAQLAAYRKSLWSWLGAMALLLLIGQWLLLRWGLSPLRKVAEEIRAMQEGGKEKLEGEYPQELTLLTENLNTLLARERAQQKRYRDALADLAHSLKTPLALIRGANRAENENLQQTLDDQVARMDKIVGYHLQRAATAGKSGLSAPVPLRPMVMRTLSALEKVYAEKSLHSIVEIESHLRFRGDEGDLMEMLGNVLDNACKWCRSQVRVTAASTQGQISIQIEDDGPGIPQNEVHRILQRGVRLDQSTPGQGIGLAITTDIVDAYSGVVHIDRSALGGAIITLTLPGADAD